MEQILLAQAFAERPERFRLLRRGFEKAGWDHGTLSLLEIGCSRGDAAAYAAERPGVQITAIDISEELIDEAKRLHGKKGPGIDLTYDCQDAADLPFPDKRFDGIYCEAAFSPAEEKERIVKECFRVLKPDGKMLMNDFVIKKDDEDIHRDQVIHIPCFAGVRTIDCYRELFETAGLKMKYYKEEYGELIRITMWLCKVYRVDISEIGGYLSTFFHSGKSTCKSCAEESGESFFSRAKLTYGQMIFEKGGI